MKLEEFEKAVEAVLASTAGIDILNEGDSIPPEVRNEFNLPKDMKGFEIDFNEIRMKDAALKKNIFTWFGQDILEYSLTNDHSKVVISRLNSVRVWPKAGMGYLKKARCLLKMFVRTPIFDNFMTISVLINTIVMAMDRYGIDEKEAKTLDDMNTVFTWIFIVEMACKLTAFGPKKYCGDKMNLLDGAVVILSIIELIITATGGSGGGGNL